MTGTVVIGVGNAFRQDDGAGPAVVELLSGRVAPRVRLAVSDGEPTGLLDAWSGVGSAHLVDAVRTGSAPPGTLHRWVLRPSGGQWAPPAAGAGSTHALGLAQALRLADALVRSPRYLVLHGIEVAATGWHPGLSPPVAAAAAELAERLLAELGGNGTKPSRSDDVRL